MQHKYNAKQILFVKNVPRDSATRVDGLFTKYKPLETKNLYPIGQITTLMIALPSIGVTEAALGEIDGMRMNNSVISVERYNPKQSIVARRDARKKRNNLPSGRANYEYDDEDEYDGCYEDSDGDEEERAIKETTKATKLTAKKPGPEATHPLPRTRRVSESCGISWAGLVGGKQADESSSSPKLAPTSELQPPLKITLAPATASIGPCSSPPHPQSIDRLSSHDYLYTVPQGRIPPRDARTQDSGDPLIDVDPSQYTWAPDSTRKQRGILWVPIDTTTLIRRKHCANCTFCQTRDRPYTRGGHSDS